MKSAAKLIALTIIPVLTACEDASDRATRVSLGADCKSAVASIGPPQTTSTFSALGLPTLKERFVWLATKKVTMDCVAGRVFSVAVEPYLSTEKDGK